MAKLVVKWTVLDEEENTINEGTISDIELTDDLEETLKFDTLIDGHVPTLDYVGSRPRDRE